MTARFRDALGYAAGLHAGQVRKGTEIPYISHLLAVTALVLEDGGDEDQAIAALLHDAAEDQGGLQTLDEIRSRYGERVAATVAGCSDTYADPKPPWRERKEQYLDHLRIADPDVLQVSLADKVHNARSILNDVRLSGAATMERFRGGQDGTLWYYQELASIFRERYESPLVAELTILVDELAAELDESRKGKGAAS